MKRLLKDTKFSYDSTLKVKTRDNNAQTWIAELKLKFMFSNTWKNTNVLIGEGISVAILATFSAVQVQVLGMYKVYANHLYCHATCWDHCMNLNKVLLIGARPV